MNWNEKSKEIAEQVLEEIENGVVNSYTRDDVLRGLQKAAMMGLEYECDAWCHGKSEKMQQCCETIIELFK